MPLYKINAKESWIFSGMEKNMKTALTIAGSDSCGGAGIQADIKTMTANGVYAMSAITALTAQNTTGVTGIMEVTPEFLGKQLDSVFTDIYPDAVKIGMVSSAELIETISEKLIFYNAKNIVVDTVMISTSGSKLLQDDAIETLKNCLFRQAEIISNEYGCAVLCKGGHNINDANDLLYRNRKYRWFIGERIDNKNTHGTGCTLSSAIASGLAKGMDLETSIQLAKEYVSGALRAMLDLGKGNGPLNHMWDINKKEKLQ